MQSFMNLERILRVTLKMPKVFWWDFYVINQEHVSNQNDVLLCFFKVYNYALLLITIAIPGNLPL